MSKPASGSIPTGPSRFNGVSASYNSTHEADIPSASATINERLTSDAEGDIWQFVGDNTISLHHHVIQHRLLTLI